MKRPAPTKPLAPGAPISRPASPASHAPVPAPRVEPAAKASVKDSPAGAPVSDLARADAKPSAPINPPVAEPVTAASPAAPRTFSDAEILASVPKPETRRPAEARPAPKPKPSRATPADQTRLWMNLGEAQDIKPIDIVNTVAGETGLPGKVVGTVDVRERHLFVDVASEHVNSILAKLNRTQIKGHKVKVKVA